MHCQQDRLPSGQTQTSATYGSNERARPRSNSRTATGEKIDVETRNVSLHPDGVDCEFAIKAVALAATAEAPLAIPVVEDELSSGHLSGMEDSVGRAPQQKDAVSDAICKIQQAI